MLTIGSLFSGIGGLELGLEWAGLGPVIWQVEKSEFCQAVLAKHWPHVERFGDVREVGATELAPVDLICGGFPCQDISSAGKGAGLAGERSGLWREFARIVGELQPRWVVVENVASGAKRWVDAVCGELGQLGYEALPVPLSAADVGAPHLRRRVFIVAQSSGLGQRVQRDQPERGGPSRALANADCQPLRLEQGRRSGEDGEDSSQPGQPGRHGLASNANAKSESAESVDGEVGRVQEHAAPGGWRRGPPVSPVCGVDDGGSERVDRLRALGNGVVPQCSEVIGWVLRELAGL